MPAITLKLNSDGSVSPAIIMTPGPKPTLDGVVVEPRTTGLVSKSTIDLLEAQKRHDRLYWNGGIEDSEPPPDED